MARRERKVVTVLFADLVGFTARAEQLDPEDVEAILRPYHEQLRTELERFGGTVEKFIGDAVMALFGAPVAHEDDPERAVRAALAIRDWARSEESVQVRIAVNTGEALVNLSARPDVGEGMAAGDVVNTTARLQAVAPVNGILVGQTTYRATRAKIDYQEADQVEAKGKAEPLHVWEAVAPRARVTTEVVEAATPLVGRDREVAVLRELLVRVREEAAPQLVTLVGVPGIGKSRLVHELMQLVEQGSALTYWRRGRSLPYGEGVTLWALSEIVKAQAGVLESDSDAEVTRKLREAVQSMIRDPQDAAWVEGHLQPLVGRAVADEADADRRGEGFAAWRRFFEGMAEERPLVLVFEDLHWADDQLLDFVDHLVEWASGVPILIVCTARPELLERRPGWGGGKLNATTLSLSPLSDEDTGRLLASLLERRLLPAERQQQLLARAGGNPLYAEQYVQMLGEGLDETELSVPESIQGIIAARLDRLLPDEKTLLQEASVLGKVFWLGGLLAARSQAEAEEVLHALERKGFVKRARASTVADQGEFSFLHLLVRDVAYGQMPRADRAARHLHAADWIGSLGRTDDHAEMLAHHYHSALELLRAAGGDIDEVGERARHAFRAAGDRAHSLNAHAAAARYYREALDLWASGDPERSRILVRFGESLYSVGSDDAVAVLEQASSELVSAGDHESAADAELVLAEIWWHRAGGERSIAHLARAQDLTQKGGRSAARARLLSQLSKYQMLSEDRDGAIATGREALELAEALGLDSIAASALITIGTAAGRDGDPTGVADIERGTEIAESLRSREASRGYNNLSYLLEFSGELERARDAWERSREWAEREGNAPMLRFSRATRRWWNWIAGNWDEALRETSEFIAECEAGAAHPAEPNVRWTRALIRLARGDADGALADAQQAIHAARRTEEPYAQMVGFHIMLRVQVETGRLEEARTTMQELLSYLDRGVAFSSGPVDLALAANRLGLVTETKAALDRRNLTTRWSQAALALLTGGFVEAADILGQMGAVPYEADARFLAAEALAAAGNPAGADKQLQKALGFWRSVGATRYIRQAEALLAA